MVLEQIKKDKESGLNLLSKRGNKAQSTPKNAFVSTRKISSFKYTKQEALKEIDLINKKFKLKLSKLKLTRVSNVKQRKKLSNNKIKTEEVENNRFNGPKIEIIRDTTEIKE